MRKICAGSASALRDKGKKWQGVAKRKRRKGTTTDRRDSKTSTTFCVFLLTGKIQKPILRFQIRGTWKRQTDRVVMQQGPCEPTNRVQTPKTKREVERGPASRGGDCCEAEQEEQPAAEHWLLGARRFGSNCFDAVRFTFFSSGRPGGSSASAKAEE